MAGERLERGVHPKIVLLLGRPEAELARRELELCERLGISPSQFRGRPSVTTTWTDDLGVTRTVTASAWTAEDRALMLAWRDYQDSLCRCGEPKAHAWHPGNDGEYAAPTEDMVTCYACTAIEKALNPKADPVRYPRLTYLRDETTKPLPPWPKKLTTT